MISGLHIGTELRRFTRFKLTRLAIVVISVLPILYSTFYLWSFWNPFGQVDKLPVALVNSDTGAMVGDQRLDAGQQVIDGLLADESLNWQLVSQQDAIEGVKNGRYYFAVELTEDFSQAVASPSQTTDPQPRQATIQATYNDTNGYLSTIIGENAMRQVLNVVSERIGSQAVDKLLVGLLDAGTGIARAADGSAKITDGLAQLKDGSGRLVDGLTQAKDGSQQLADGTDTLADGVGQLKDGSSRLAEGTDTLTAGVDQLAGAVGAAAGTISDVAGKAQNLQTQVDAFGSRVQAADDKVRQLEAVVAASSSGAKDFVDSLRRTAATVGALPDPTAKDTARHLNALADQLEQHSVRTSAEVAAVTSGVHDLNYEFNNPDSQLRGAFGMVSDGIQKFGQLEDGVNQLHAGAHALNDGAHALDDGIAQLQGGVGRLQDGSHRLNDGNAQLLDGTKTLDSGLGTAHDGAATLTDGLTTGVSAVPNWNPDQRQRVSSVMGGPVEVSEANDAGVNTFGAGLAPFFFSLALYVGAIAAFFLIKPLQLRAVSSGISPVRAAVDGFLTPGLIGIAQAFSVGGLTLLLTPLKAASVVGLLAFTILVAFMFMAMNQTFLALLTTGPGRVISMAFLMVQLVSSGGLYPIETEPALLGWLHPFMPMTYAVNGFRQLLYGGYDARLPVAIVMVLFFTVLSLAITAYAAARDRTWTIKRLHPVIQM